MDIRKHHVVFTGDAAGMRSRFINLLLGAPVIPERSLGSRMPVIKIVSSGWFDQNEVSLFTPERENDEQFCKTPLSDWNDLPADLDEDSYIEINLPNHPLLNEGLVLWDIPLDSDTDKQTQTMIRSFFAKYFSNISMVFRFSSWEHVPPDPMVFDILKSLQTVGNADNKQILRRVRAVLPLSDNSESSQKEAVLRAVETLRANGVSAPVVSLFLPGLPAELNTALPVPELITLSKKWEQDKPPLSDYLERYSEEALGLSLFFALSSLKSDKFFWSPYLNVSEETLMFLAENDNAEAQYVKAQMCYEQNDFEKELYWLKRAAELGYPAAQFSLGKCLYTGLHINQDMAEGLRWIEQSAGKDYDDAQVFYSVFLDDFDDSQHEKAVMYIERAAYRNHPEALFQLSRCYNLGIEVECDEELRFEYLLRAAYLNHPKALSEVGVILVRKGVLNFREGHKTDGDPIGSAILFRLEKAGNETVFLSVGRSLLEESKRSLIRDYGTEYSIPTIGGRSPEEDEECRKQGFAIIKRADEQGIKDAKGFLALCYLEGTGCEKNEEEGLRIGGEAAAEGSPVGIFVMAQAFLNRPDDEQSHRRGVEFLKKGLDLGLNDIEYLFGLCLFEGKGIKQDEEQGIEYIIAAARAGSAQALQFLEELQSGTEGEE